MTYDVSVGVLRQEPEFKAQMQAILAKLLRFTIAQGVDIPLAPAS